MPGALPATPSAAIAPPYNLWLSRLPASRRGAAPDQQAVEHAPELSLPRTAPRSLSLRHASYSNRSPRQVQSGVMEQWSNGVMAAANSLLHYSPTPTLQSITPPPAAQAQQESA